MINLYQKTWTEINNNIAQKIVRLRKRKKITQKQLAARSGVSLGSLKRFEQSGETVSYTHLDVYKRQLNNHAGLVVSCRILADGA